MCCNEGSAKISIKKVGRRTVLQYAGATVAVLSGSLFGLPAIDVWGDGHAKHAGAIDDNEFEDPDSETPRPPVLGDAPTGCDCTCTITGSDTIRAGCPAPGHTENYEDYTAEEYTADIKCSGEELVDVLWVKAADVTAILGGSAPMRWCDDNGNNRLKTRADFRCKLELDNSKSKVKAPMCSKGKYTFCVFPIVKCSDGKLYRGQHCLKEVTAS